MLASDSAFSAGLILGFIAGATIAGLVAYLALVPRMKLRFREGVDEGKQAALGNISMERIPDIACERFVRKKYYLVIRERLLNNNLPISPFWEYKFLLAERLDTDELNAVKDALSTMADRVLGLADLKATVFRLIKPKPGKKLVRK